MRMGNEKENDRTRWHNALMQAMKLGGAGGRE